MNFSEKDHAFMKIAIEEAKIASDEGNFPVGACLVVDGTLIAKERNQLHLNQDWVSHAEMRLISKYSSLIKESFKKGSTITIYTSLDPCFMCLGASTLNRISRIVYACPDPFTGVAEVYLDTLLPVGYKNMLPKISGGLMKEDSYNLITEHMQKQGKEKWNEALELYKNIK